MTFATIHLDGGGLLQDLCFSGDGYLYMGGDTHGAYRSQRDGTTHLYGQQSISRNRGQGPQNAWHQIAAIFAPQHDPAGAGNTVLIAVGDTGSNGGIMKSTDRMDTWTMLSRTPQFAGNTYHVPGGVQDNWTRSGRRYFVEDTSYLFVASMKQGIMRSADHGSTWPDVCNMAGTAPGSNYYARALCADPATPTTLYAGFGDRGGTTNFGGLWKATNAHVASPAVPNFLQCSGLPANSTVEDVIVADGWVYALLGSNGLWVASTANTNSWTQIGGTGAMDPSSWWSSLDVINDGSGNHLIAVACSKPVKLSGDNNNRCVVRFTRTVSSGAITATLQMTNLTSQLNVNVVQIPGGTRTWWNSGTGLTLGKSGFVNPYIRFDPDPTHFGDIYLGASQGLYRWVSASSQWQLCNNGMAMYLGHAITAASWGMLYTDSDFGTNVDLAVGGEDASSLNAVNPINSAEAYGVAISEDETIMYTSSTATNQKYTTIAGDVYSAPKALNPTWTAMGLAAAVDSATSVAEGHKTAQGLCALNNSGGTKCLLAATPNTGLWLKVGSGAWAIASSAFCTGGTGNLVNFAHVKASQYVYVFDQASGIWRSNNYGAVGSWVQVKAVTNSDGLCGTIAAHPTRTGEIWYTTQAGLFKITGAHTGTVGSGATLTGPIATGVGSDNPGPCGVSDTGYVYVCTQDAGNGTGLALSSDGLHWVNGDPTGSLGFIASRAENMAFIPHVGTTPPVCLISNTNVVAFGSPETISTGPGTSGEFTERQKSLNTTGTNTTTTASPVGAICNIGLPTSAQATHQQAADYFDGLLGTQYRPAYTAQKVYYQNNAASGQPLTGGVYPQAFVDGAGQDITAIVNGGAIIYLCYQPNPNTSTAEDIAFVASVQWWANNHPLGAAGIVVIVLQEPQNASWLTAPGTPFTQSSYANYFAHYCPLAQAVTDPGGHHVRVAYDAAGHSLTTGGSSSAACTWLTAIIALGVTPDIGMIDFYGSSWENLTSGGTTNLTPVAPLITICNSNGMAFGYGEIGRAEGTSSYTPSLFPTYIAYIISSMMTATKRDAVMWYNGNKNTPNQNTLTAGSDMIAPLQQLYNALMAFGSIDFFFNEASPPTGGYATLANSSIFVEFTSNDCNQTIWANDTNWQLVADGKAGTATAQSRSQVWAYLNAPVGLYGTSTAPAIFSYSNPSATVKGLIYEETIPAGYAAAVDSFGGTGALGAVASPAALSVSCGSTQQYTGGLVRGFFSALSSPAFSGSSWAPGSGYTADGVVNSLTAIFQGVRGTSASGTQSAGDTLTYATGTMTSWSAAIATFYCAPGAGTPLSFTTTILPDGAEGSAYSQTVGTIGGVPPVTVGLASGSPAVPTGLTLDTTGLLHGTPSTGTHGPYNLQFLATDSASNTATQSITLTIDQILSMTGNVLADARENLPYSDDLSGMAAGGVPPYTFSTTFTFPGAPDLTLSSAGLLSGTPSLGTASTLNFPVTVADANGHTATGVFTLTIQPAVPVIFPPPGGSTDPITAVLMDENLNVIAPINFATLTAQLYYNFVGAWSMTIPFDDDFWQIVKKFITIDPVTGAITQNGLCTVEVDWQGLFTFGGKVETPGYSFTNNQQAGTGVSAGPVAAPGPLITLGGADYLALVANRIAFPDPTKAWGGQTPTGKKTYTGPLENVLKALVSDNVGPGAVVARSVDLLDIDIPQGAGGTVTYDVKFAQSVDLNLMDIIRTLVGTGGPMGVRIIRNGQRLLFQTYVPTDRTATAYFSPDIGNLTSVQLSLQDATATTVLAQAGAAPLFFATSANPNPETDWSRIEVYSDQTSQTTPAQAQQAATDVLTQGQASPSLTMTATDIPLLTFGRDYFLGDVVSVEPRPGDVYSDIVSGVSLSCDANQQPAIQVVPTVGYSSDPGAIDPAFAQQLLRRVQRLERRLNAQIG